jgi:predicted XRE-type DNA-binding protein
VLKYFGYCVLTAKLWFSQNEKKRLNETKKQDIMLVYNYIKNENKKQIKTLLSERQIQQRTADMLHVARRSVSVVIGESHNDACQ